MNTFTYNDKTYIYYAESLIITMIFCGTSLVTDDDVRLAAKEDLALRLITEGARHVS